MEYRDDCRYRFNPFAYNYVATAGVMNFAEEHKCYWLLDIVASYREQIKGADYLKIVDFVLNGKGGEFSIRDEITGVLVVQEVEFTDLTEDAKFWLITEEDLEVLILPSEY